VLDDDGGSSAPETTQITVYNVDTTVKILPGSEPTSPDQTKLKVSVSDPGVTAASRFAGLRELPQSTFRIRHLGLP
jgi:hypothetical protein